MDNGDRTDQYRNYICYNASISAVDRSYMSRRLKMANQSINLRIIITEESKTKQAAYRAPFDFNLSSLDCNGSVKRGFLVVIQRIIVSHDILWESAGISQSGDDEVDHWVQNKKALCPHSWQPEAEIVIEDNQELGSAYGKVAAGCADEETPGEEAGYRTLDRFARLLALFGGHVATRGEAGAAGLAVAGGGGTQRWVIAI